MTVRLIDGPFEGREFKELAPAYVLSLFDSEPHGCLAFHCTTVEYRPVSKTEARWYRSYTNLHDPSEDV